MQYLTHILPNGIRLIHIPDKSPVAYCGVLVNTGSRDEDEDKQGMAHFIEHVIFKGTKKRRAYHILSRLDDVGGDLNAYTTKEETGLHATFLSEYYERAIELMSDIIYNSTFPLKEIEKEKEVIYDEINSYLDSPSELIFDDFEDFVFEGHPLGRNILGTKEKVSTFDITDIQNFIKRNYHTDQIVLCSLGDINFNKLVKYFEKYFGHAKEHNRVKKRLPFTNYVPREKTVNKETYQAHCIIGNLAYNMNHKQKLGLTLLNNILGGPAMNSRLNMSLREKNGIAYNIDSNYTSYSDTGVLNIYFGTDEENLKRSLKLIHKELNLLRDTKLGTLQLHKAQKQLIGQIAIGTENKESLLLSMGKSFLYFNKMDDLQTINSKIRKLTSSQLLEIANEVLDPSKLSTLIFK